MGQAGRTVALFYAMPPIDGWSNRSGQLHIILVVVCCSEEEFKDVGRKSTSCRIYIQQGGTFNLM
jgi:hypothetical protein